MKYFLVNWLIGAITILVLGFFMGGIPFLISFIGLPDWVVFAYLFALCSLILGLGVIKD